MSEAFSWSVNCKRTLSTSMSAILNGETDDEQQNNRQFLYGKVSTGLPHAECCGVITKETVARDQG